MLLPDPAAALARLSQGDLVITRRRSGALCFSVGSIRWTAGLSDWSDSSHVRAITTAVLLDLLDDACLRGRSTTASLQPSVNGQP